jgi:hypothetical protein
LDRWQEIGSDDDSADLEAEALMGRRRPSRARLACAHFWRSFWRQLWTIVSAVRRFGTMYWLGLAVAVSYYSAVFPFIGIGTCAACLFTRGGGV